MSRIIKTELYKAFHNRNLYLLMLITIAFQILTVVYIPQAYELGLTGRMLMHQTVKFLSIFLIITIVGLASFDQVNNTTKNIITTGISRTKIYVGRLVSYMIVAAFLLFIFTASYGIIGTVINGYGATFSIQELGYVAESFSLQLLYLLCVVSMATFVASLVRNQTIATVITAVVTGLDSLIFIAINQLFNIDLMDYSMQEILSQIDKLTIDGQLFLHMGIAIVIFVFVLSFIGKLIYNKKDFR